MEQNTQRRTGRRSPRKYRLTGTFVIDLIDLLVCLDSVAIICHFAVGSARGAFTGRSIVRSSLDMLAVGLVVAIVGYVAGNLISQALS